MKDLYAILGVEKTATPHEIRSAYRTLALRHHPDRNGGSAKSEETFREISSAYTVLADEKQRKQYDHDRARPAPKAAPGGHYTPPPAPNEEGWVQRRKYEAVRNSWFYQEGSKRRKAQNQQTSYRGGSGLTDPFGEAMSTGLTAPIELGTPLKIVGDPPQLGKSVNVIQGAFGSLPGVFLFKKDE